MRFAGTLRACYWRQEVQMTKRVDVTLSEQEAAIVAAAVRYGGHGDKAGAIRALAVQRGRVLLQEVAPVELAKIDRRFGGEE